jgi:hypothetical protein
MTANDHHSIITIDSERRLNVPEGMKKSSSMDAEAEAALDRLYAAARDRFTAERDALAKQLKTTDKEAAAAVKTLRRPAVTAWALNQVARTEPDEIAALLEADALLSRSQRGGAGRQALAEAARTRREIIGRLVAAASRTLAEAGHPDSPANRDRIARTLAAVAVDAEGREALSRGRLTGDLTPSSLWEAGGFSPEPGQAPGGGEPDEAALDAAASAERRRDLRRKAEDLTAEAKRLGADAARLDADAAKAEATARVARSVANEARRSADEATARAETAARDSS